MAYNDDLQQQIEDCEARSDQLSDWEASFIDSISGQLARTGSLSERQIEQLDKIWDKVTSRRR